MGLWVCIGMIGGLVEDVVLYHDVMKALTYVKKYLKEYKISEKKFIKERAEGLSVSAKAYFFENDLGHPKNHYQWLVKELKIDDGPRAALTSGSREQVLHDVNRLMKEGYYPLNISTVATLTEDPIPRPIIVEHTVLMTTWKDF
jgi:hypothetical protein